MDSQLEPWWLTARARVRQADRRRFDTMVVLTAWMLWKQRNSRVFNNISHQCNAGQLVQWIKEELCLWELAHAGGSAPASQE
jgi:hypothetical protein